MGRESAKGGSASEVTPLVYRSDVINAAIGGRRLTNVQLAKLAGVGAGQVSALRNGVPNVALMTLKKVCDALNLTLAEVFEPKPEDGNGSGVAAGSHV